MAEPPRRPLLGGGEQLRRTVRPPPGGPPPKDLFTPEEAAARLRPQLAGLLQRAREIPTELRGPNVIFRATLQANFLAASHHPSHLLRLSGLRSVGSAEARAELRTRSRSSSDELAKALFLSGPVSAIERVRDLILVTGQQHRNAWEDVRKLAEVRLPTLAEVVESAAIKEKDRPITWEAVLHPPAGETEDERTLEAEEVLAKWIELVRAVAGQGAIRPALRRRIDGLTFIPILAPPALVETLAEFNPLRSLHPMPELRAWNSSVYQLPLEIPPVLPSAPQSPQTSVRIAIFDGGIEPLCPLAGPYTRLIRMTQEPVDSDALRHGHIVTNAVLYGCHQPGDLLPPPIAVVDHFRVLPPEKDAGDPFNLDLYRTLEHIEDALSSGDYDIASLSLGPHTSLRDGDRPHAWTATLDRLTRRHGVLFVTAVGNLQSEDDDEPRIRPPADALNTLAIGACTARTGRLECAPYSARGPGRHGGRVRPTAVAFGGDLRSQPFWGLGPSGRWTRVEGTSYAAPLVTHALAGLAETLGRERADPATLRAFIVHHAERCRAHHSMTELGYGRVPEVLSRLLDCREDSVTVLCQDSIRRDEMGSLILPIPSGLHSEQWVELRFTLCFTGPTDAAEAMDYSRAGIQLRLRPHARRFAFRHEDGREEVLDELLDAEKIEDLTEAGFEQASRPLPEPLSYRRLREQEQVRAGKWDTTLSARLRKRAGSFYRPELEIKYLARRRGPLVSGPRVPELRYTLLLTIQAMGATVYEAVQTEYPVLTPIQVRANIEI